MPKISRKMMLCRLHKGIHVINEIVTSSIMKNKTKKIIFTAIYTAFMLALAGCGATVLRADIPLEVINKAQIPGIEEVRFWGDEPIPNARAFQAERFKQIQKTRPGILQQRNRTVNLLALSGGGPDGAFGAGLLNGWTKSGKRPRFEFVAGVSTGALLAPFAFLGPEYDDEARDIYSKYGTSDILRPNLLGGLIGGGTALANSEPLANVIARYVDRKFLAKVAREHNRGRRLLVGTTNLDAQRPVIWDMGRIATRNSDQALKLFRRVLLASASIPGVFPPIFIEAKSGGQTYKEMHVDGGVTDNAFLLPAEFDRRKFEQQQIFASWKLKMYIIVNSKTRPEPKVVKASTFGIAGRSISTLIKQQTQGDVLKLYLRAKRNDVDFNLASVPDSFDVKSKEAFDKDYMKALFQVGFNAARKGYKWQKQPEGL